MDDFALSDRFLAAHLPVRNYIGKDTISTRMYPEGIGQLFEGWTKNMATASQSTHWFVMLFVNSWIFDAFLASLLPIIAWVTGQTVVAGISVVIYILYGIHIWILAKRTGNFKKWIILFFPFLFLFFTYVFHYCLFRTHILHSVKWKGRKIKV